MAAREAGRDPQSVTLIAVTKTFPAVDTVALARLGVTAVGESRDQQAKLKFQELQPHGIPLEWHFIGQIQRNKITSILRYSDVVHSVDREQLVLPLAQAAAARGRPLEVLVQVNLDPANYSDARAGVSPAELFRLADLVAARPELSLRGLMTVAPQSVPAAATFEQLSGLAERIRSTHPGALWLSAGMSSDLEVAVRYGATHVRIGGAILGNRPRLG